jgi:altronate dehydratase small subunit
MNNEINAILIHESDNVATAIVDLVKGDVGQYSSNDKIFQVIITEAIPKYHKFAARDIAQGELIRKYGEVVGLAIQDIAQGAHVHVHNIVSPDAKPRR